MWSEIRNINPVLYFDATGSIIVDIPNQNKPLLYSLVAHDVKNKCIMPIGEFVTTSHTSNSITHKLSEIRNYIIDSSPKASPEIVVTDFSWASINAVNKTFNNNNSILSYLNWSFDFFVLQRNKVILKDMFTTIIYICSVHTLKNVIKKSKLVIVDEKVRKAFIFCFAILQNCVNHDTFNYLLFHVYKLFNMNKMNAFFFESYRELKQEVQNHNLQSTDVNNDATSDNEGLKNTTIVFSSQESVESIKHNSPYTAYYVDILNKYKSILTENQNQNEIEMNKDNEYYSPALFDIILEYLHLLPLWTGLAIHTILVKYPEIKIKTRLDNNPVENNFGHIKTNLFQNKKLTPSEMCAKLYDRYKLKYILHYMNVDEAKMGKIPMH